VYFYWEMRLYLFVLLIGTTLHAQNLGSLSGRITDSKTNTPLPGATVVLVGTNLGAIADDQGYFVLEDIPPQTYNLQVSFLGYETRTLFNQIIKSVGTPEQVIQLVEQTDALEEVVLSSPFRTTRETPLSTQTFSAVEIETYPGGNNDITKVVQSMPGISPSIGGFRNDIIIRGGAPNETVYYLDGIEIPNINHFSTQGSAGGPVGMINVSFVKDVTLSSAAFGAEYDNPLSGVLSFQQRDGNATGFGTNFRLGASEAAMTFEGPLFRKDSTAPAATTFLFSVRRSYLQFLFELIGLPIRPDYWDYQWKVKHRIDANNTLTFLGIGAVDDFSVKAPETFDERQQAAIEQVPIIKQQSITVGVSWNHVFSEIDGLMTTSLSTNRLDNNFSRFLDNEAQRGLVFQNDAYEWETKLRMHLRWYRGAWKLATGFNLQYSDYLNNTESIQYNLQYTTAIDFMKYGFFGQATRSYLDNRLDFSIGFRMDADSYTTASNLIQNFSPRMSFSYGLTEDQRWKINGSVGRYYKIPTYTMLGYQDRMRVFVNQNLRYTQSDHWVAGLEHNLGPAARLTVEGFYKNYSQYPVSVRDGVALANKGGGFEVLGNEPVTSDGKGKAYGLELLYQQKLSGNFYGTFAYTYFNSKFTGQSGTFLPSVWDSRHLMSFTGGYKLKRNWELSARWRYAGQTPYVPVNQSATLDNYPEIVLDYTRLGDELLNPFSQVDVRLDKKWNFSQYSLNLYFDFQNFLAQATPAPDDFGLARDAEGALLLPRQLVRIANDDQNNVPIPSFGIVVDF
jgi:hypothetical protein